MTDETRLVADLGLESIQLLELVSAVERAFEIRVDEGDIEPIRTIGDLVDAIVARLAPPPQQ